LLAVVLTACGIIFNYSIDAQRTAGATAEIMRNLRAITDQLNADFAGYVGPGIIEPNSFGQMNADEIEFIATGDFQTAGVYGANNQTVRGNIARIYYGQATSPNPLSDLPDDIRNKILARKVVIITPGASSAVNDCVNTGGINGSECEPNSLIIIQKKTKYELVNNYHWLARPTINLSSDPNSIRIYLVRGVGNLKIEYLQWPVSSKLNWQTPVPTDSVNTPALRFTFTLYDSKGIIKTGRRFEHIVYIGK
jgi:hypothetical protein